MTYRAVVLLLALDVVGPAVMSAQDGRRIIEVGGLVVHGVEQGSFEGQPYENELDLFGARGGLRAGPVFVRGHYVSGRAPAAGDLPERDVRLAEVGTGVFFVPQFRLDGAGFAREYASALGTQRWLGVKVGAGFQGTLWPGLLEARAVGHYIPLVRSSVAEDRVTLGWDGEVEVSIRHNRIPLRLALGYRVERLDTGDPATNQGAVRRNRLSALLFSFQISL